MTVSCTIGSKPGKMSFQQPNPSELHHSLQTLKGSSIGYIKQVDFLSYWGFSI